MTDPRIVSAKQALVATAGGFLRNPGGPGTCNRCRTPTATQPLCSQCVSVSSLVGAQDLTGFMTYAGYFDPIHQAGLTMRGYKNPSIPRGAHWRTVALLSALGLIAHVRCPGAILGAPVTAWATVPSLPPKPHAPVHPLNEIARQLTRDGAHEVPLIAAESTSNPRAIDVNHFSVDPTVAAGHHVLLVEDTWTGGGHVTSAAMALKRGGATHVSVLVLARWLSIGWEATTPAWAKSRLASPDFDPDVCPWTAGACP